uniref:Uncharacterized protein n=1 Tax=Oryza barthii TaxID=65489 RepID=A0A0D3FVX6_9ORYZ
MPLPPVSDTVGSSAPNHLYPTFLQPTERAGDKKFLQATPWVPLPPIISTLHSSNQLSEQGTTEQVPSVRDMASTAKQAAGGGADRVDGGASGKGGKVRTVRSISHNPTLSFFTPFVEDLVDPVVKHIWRW